MRNFSFLQKPNECLCVCMSACGARYVSVDNVCVFAWLQQRNDSEIIGGVCSPLNRGKSSRIFISGRMKLSV